MEQPKFVEYMIKNPGCTIIGHRLPNGKNAYRLRDVNVNPVMNISEAEFNQKFKDDTIIKKDNVWILNN